MSRRSPGIKKRRMNWDIPKRHLVDVTADCVGVKTSTNADREDTSKMPSVSRPSNKINSADGRERQSVKKRCEVIIIARFLVPRLAWCSIELAWGANDSLG